MARAKQLEIHLHIIQLRQAKDAGLRRYFNGETCKNGHLTERLTSNRLCLGCARKSNKKFYTETLKSSRSTGDGKAKRLKNAIRYMDKNRDAVTARRREKYHERRDEHIARRRQYYVANLPKVIATNALVVQRRRQRAPLWLSTFQLAEMAEFYIEAARRSAETGIKHHVDHIVPLLGKKVSGLHVPWNMQVITAKSNIAKSNRHASD